MRIYEKDPGRLEGQDAGKLAQTIGRAQRFHPSKFVNRYSILCGSLLLDSALNPEP